MNLLTEWELLPLSNQDDGLRYQLYSGNEIFCPYMSMGISSAIFGVTQKEGGPFGATIVRNGEVVAVAHNTVLKDFRPTAHAEANAIEMAIKNTFSTILDDCILYATAEPCPMCRAYIIQAGIKTVYVGVSYQTSDKHGFSDSKFEEEVKKSWDDRIFPSFRKFSSAMEFKALNVDNFSLITKHFEEFSRYSQEKKFPAIFYDIMGEKPPSDPTLLTVSFQENQEVFDSMFKAFQLLSAEQKKVLRQFYWTNTKCPLSHHVNIAGIVHEGNFIRGVEFTYDVASSPLPKSAIDTCITKLCNKLQKVDLSGYTLYSYHVPTSVECGIIMWSRLSRVVIVNPEADIEALSNHPKMSENNGITFIREHMSKSCETVFNIWNAITESAY